MNESPGESQEPGQPTKTGRPSAYTDKIADDIIAACRSGFTMEKAAELVGLEPKTVQNWVGKRKEFGERIKKARREHELSLLRDIELAGAKSWQAKAWMAERVYNYCQPSARLQVAGEVQHGVSGSFAALLAGIASRKMKQAQVIDQATLPEAKLQIADSQRSANHLSQNEYCINKSSLTDNDLQKTSTNQPKIRHKQMRRRKPRQESLRKYPKGDDTGGSRPPATDSTRITPVNNSDTKQKEV